MTNLGKGYQVFDLQHHFSFSEMELPLMAQSLAQCDDYLPWLTLAQGIRFFYPNFKHEQVFPVTSGKSTAIYILEFPQSLQASHN